jgi:hypothetical protein
MPSGPYAEGYLAPGGLRPVRGHDEPFSLPSGTPHAGWTTTSSGALERGGGPLVMRVEVDSKVGGGYRWTLLSHSWVAPVLVQLSSGPAKSLHVAKSQCFWAAYAQLMSWQRALSDDATLGL